MQKLNYVLRTAAFIMLLTIGISINGKAQSAADAYVSMANSQSPITSGTYYVLLSDTGDVSQIETKLGTASGLSDILNQTYDYDVSTGLPTGYTYLRQGNKLVLGITNINTTDTYYGTVRIKNGSGTWSSSYSFITN